MDLTEEKSIVDADLKLLGEIQFHLFNELTRLTMIIAEKYNDNICMAIRDMVEQMDHYVHCSECFNQLEDVFTPERKVKKEELTAIMMLAQDSIRLQEAIYAALMQYRNV